MNENKFVSANATVKKGNDTLKGDTITAFFKDTKRFEIDRAFSNGHTEIRSEGKKAFADRGEYEAKTGLVKLFDNVKITPRQPISVFTAVQKKHLPCKTMLKLKTKAVIRPLPKTAYTT
mgnify:CR=1 FL=1